MVIGGLIFVAHEGFVELDDIRIAIAKLIPDSVARNYFGFRHDKCRLSSRTVFSARSTTSSTISLESDACGFRNFVVGRANVLYHSLNFAPKTEPADGPTVSFIASINCFRQLIDKVA
jgi:hypothetical protein